MPDNLLSLVLTYCQLCNSKNQTPKQTCQHFLLSTSIYLAFNRTSVPEADATRDKHSAKPKFVRQQFKGALNPYTIHKLLCVRSRSSRACPHVSSPIACIKNCSGMHSTHLLVFNTWLRCQDREVAKRHPWVLQPGTVRFSPATYRQLHQVPLVNREVCSRHRLQHRLCHLPTRFLPACHLPKAKLQSFRPFLHVEHNPSFLYLSTLFFLFSPSEFRPETPLGALQLTSPTTYCQAMHF